MLLADLLSLHLITFLFLYLSLLHVLSNTCYGKTEYPCLSLANCGFDCCTSVCTHTHTHTRTHTHTHTHTYTHTGTTTMVWESDPSHATTLSSTYRSSRHRGEWLVAQLIHLLTPYYVLHTVTGTDANTLTNTILCVTHSNCY